VLAKWDDVVDDLLRKRNDIHQRLNAGSSDAKAIDKVVDDALANQKALWDADEKRLVELRKLLTPSQTARLLVVLPAFERRLQNQLRRVGAGGGRGGERRGEEQDDFDVDDVPPLRRR
jgi:Spy/CpxP family protein refolding chaperone